MRFLLLLSLLLIGCTKSEHEVRTYSVPKTQPNTAAPASSANTPATMNDSARLEWQTPAGWEEKGSSQMRLASFSVAGKGDASIVVLGGDAGGLTANVNRWRGQVGLASVSEEAVTAASRAMKGALGDFRFFDIKPAESGKDGILAAVFSLGSRSVFVKLTGSAEVLTAQKAGFLRFCQTLRESNGTR